MLVLSFETIIRNREGVELMANRDHDQNPNQNPNRSGKMNPGDRNQQSQNPGQKPPQQGDTMPANQRGGRAPQGGGNADLGKDPSSKR